MPFSTGSSTEPPDSGVPSGSPEQETLEQSQDNKLNMVFQKLMLKPGEELLDIGCGWGTCVRHAAKHFQANATGVTIAKRQTEYAMERAPPARRRCT